MLLSLSTDGVRWSAPSATPFTCHDASRPPTVRSVAPDAVDVSSAPATVAVRAGNLRRAGALRCRFAGGGRAFVTNGTVAEASLGDAVSSVGTAACALPGVAALGADVGTLTVALSAGGSEWSASPGAPAQLTLYDGAAPPRLDAVEPAALDTSWRAGEAAHALRLRGWNFAPGARCELAGAHFDATLLDAPFGNGSAPHEVGCTCLLYTSPSPRDQRGSRMPSSA